MVRFVGARTLGVTASLFTWALVLLSSTSLATAQLGPASGNTTSVDPFADPQHDRKNPLRYITSNTLSAVSFCTFLCLKPTHYHNTHSAHSSCLAGGSGSNVHAVAQWRKVHAVHGHRRLQYVYALSFPSPTPPLTRPTRQRLLSVLPCGLVSIPILIVSESTSLKTSVSFCLLAASSPQTTSYWAGSRGGCEVTSTFLFPLNELHAYSLSRIL